MKIICKDCGKLVVKEELLVVKKKDGGSKIIFDININKQEFKDIKPQGTIIKNNSSDPKKWTGLCSECQSLNKEIEK